MLNNTIKSISQLLLDDGIIMTYCGHLFFPETLLVVVTQHFFVLSDNSTSGDV